MRKQDHVTDGCLVGKKHDQPINADPFSGRRRHAVFQRAQKIFVHIVGFLVTGFPLSDLRLKTLALIEWIIQLGEGVGDLPSGNIKLEPVGQRRVRILATGQRGDLNGIIGDDSRLHQLGLDSLFEDFVQDRHQVGILFHFHLQSCCCLHGGGAIAQDRRIETVDFQNRLSVGPTTPGRGQVDLLTLIFNGGRAENLFPEPCNQLFRTKTDEFTVEVRELTFLSKALRPLPEKWHGLTDVETRYRQRYVDLIANPSVHEIFATRSRIIAGVRAFLIEKGFLEVETPMMQPIPGGATARPFVTHHNALGIDLYLRIAPELYLKRLLVGGFNKVFELNRNFRNEGISRRHNPEFTMLEAYWAYADFSKIANLVEDMVCHLAEIVSGSLKIEHRDADGNVTRTLDLSRPWRRARYRDLIMEVAGDDWFGLTTDAKRERAKSQLGVEIISSLVEHEITQHVFEKLVEEKTFDPLFVTHCPKELVPLAKQNPEDDSLVDVYELIINGQEISPGYTELNDPTVQRQRLVEQVGEETQKIDEEFLLALEHGMPPAGGFGLGIDRLTMLLTGAESIRDVILFPLLKPKR